MPNLQTIDLILQLLDSGTLSPQDLLHRLREKGVNQAEAKENLSFLVNDEQVELTRDSTLRKMTTVGV